MQENGDRGGRPAVEFEPVELVEGNLRVTLEYIGEGFDGGYSGEPWDEPLLRVRFDEMDGHGEWSEHDSSSHCTRLSARLPRDVVACAVRYVMEKYVRYRHEGHSISGLGQQVSWMAPLWVWERTCYRCQGVDHPETDVELRECDVSVDRRTFDSRTREMVPQSSPGRRMWLCRGCASELEDGVRAACRKFLVNSAYWSMLHGLVPGDDPERDI